MAAKTAVLAALAVVSGLVVAAPAHGFTGAGDFRLTAHHPGSGYAPTFTGNGRLGVRVPAQGQGYAGGTVPAQSELAGFYARPAKPQKVSDTVVQRANLPTWSTLAFSDGGRAFSLRTGRTTGWRQTLDLRTGVVSTSSAWHAPNGHVTKLAYQVLTDRARQFVGLVRLRITPAWSGQATITDEIDGTPAALTDQVGQGHDAGTGQDWITVRTQGTGILATLASQLTASPNVIPSATVVDQSRAQSIGRRLTFPVSAGRTYTFVKYVGIAESQDSADTVSAARATAAQAASSGFAALRRANDAAWAKLWRGRIDVLGDRRLATDVNASEFYLWSSTRAGVNWSISPAGLSSNGYDGHIFWDAETWMYPSLLAQHAGLAAAMNAYRQDRLGGALAHAGATGYAGARFPWESALDGSEQIPPPTSVNSEGLYEQHITADVALAQWQYYLATGDRSWLARRGWPVLSGAAAFWASRVRPGPGGRYHIRGITGPDEENPNVADEAFTIAGARTTLRIAIRAARVLGLDHPGAWSRIAAGLLVPVGPSRRLHPEFSGYQGQLVKQADVTLLQYPWEYPMPPAVARHDLAFYVPRTDPMGPSMSDAVNSIDSSALQTAGCASFVYTERSYQPFIRDVFHQFSETSTGGAFTFMTGIGGFLQEFLYGYSGMRWRAGSVALAPSLTGQLRGVVLHDVSWRGRRFQVSIKLAGTTVRLSHGAALPIRTPRSSRLVSPGHAVTLVTARPDLTPTRDTVRCAAARASSSVPGAPPLAAVDGSSATSWQPASLPATLTVPVLGSRPVRRAVLIWGRQWPPAPKPNVEPPPHPVIVRRATRYEFLVSTDGRRWRRLLTVLARAGTTETLQFPPQRLRYVRLRISSGSGHKPPLLQELSLTG